MQVPPFTTHFNRIRPLMQQGGILAAGGRYATENLWYHDGEWRPDRVRLHERLIEELLSKTQSVEAPVAVVMAGPPGAGKSTYWRRHGPDISAQLLQSLSAEELALTGLTATCGLPIVEIDSDYFKGELIKDGQDNGWIDQITPDSDELGFPSRELAPMDLASLVHTESSRVFDETLKIAARESRPILLDMVCGNFISAKKRLQVLADAEYRTVTIINLVVDKDTSRDRVRTRWISGCAKYHQNKNTLGARWVPTEVSDSLFDGPLPASDRVVQQLVTDFPDLITRHIRLDGFNNDAEKVIIYAH